MTGSCATCGSPASTPRACTPCTWTSRCAATGRCRAIARVNRVFGDKPGGLVVDSLGLAHELKRALATCTGSGGTGRAALDQGEAVAAMREKYEICCGLFHGFDRSAWSDGTPAQRLGLLPAAQEHVLAREDGKERCLLAVRDLSRGLRAGRAARGGAPHPRRGVVLPGGAGGAGQARRRRGALGGSARPRRAPDRLARGGPGRGDGRVRRGRAGEAGPRDPLRRVPGRGAGHAATQPRGRAAAQAAEGRACGPPAEEHRPGSFVRRDAGADHPLLPEPRRRGRAGDRGADRPGPGDARGEHPRRGAGAVGGRARLLRRPRGQRQRGFNSIPMPFWS